MCAGVCGWCGWRMGSGQGSVDHRQGSAFPWGLMGRQQVAEHRRELMEAVRPARWLMEVGGEGLGVLSGMPRSLSVSTEGPRCLSSSNPGEE